MDSDDHPGEKVVFLDFGDKLPPTLLQNKAFIRMADLDKKNPLVQVNDLIFKGSYDHSIGTNLFFKKTINEDPPEFPFKDEPSFKLEFAAAQAKILSCKPMAVPSTIAHLPSDFENIKFNFKWDYKELLKRFEDGTLDLQDMVRTEPKGGDNKQVEKPTFSKTSTEKDEDEASEVMEIDDITVPIENRDFSNIPDVSHKVPDEVEEDYKNLLLLARTPVRREIIEEECPVDPRFKSEYEYRSIEGKVLEPPLFSYMRNTKNLDNSINIQRCITLGLLRQSGDEKAKLLTIENFENLSLKARYSVLVSYMEELKKLVNSNNAEKNSLLDEYDRTPIDTLVVFEKLVSALERRIKEIDMARKFDEGQ